MDHDCSLPATHTPKIETNEGYLSRIVLGEFGEFWGKWGGSRSLLTLETPGKLYLALSPFCEDPDLPSGQVVSVSL